MTISEAMLERLGKRGLDAEVIVRMGLSSGRRGGGEEALIIPFKREGTVVRNKYRRFDTEEGKWTSDKGAIRCAFNEDCLRDEGLLGLPLIIAEGEIDAISAIQAGFPRTISVPDGAPPPGERSAEDLRDSAKYEWLGDIKPFLTLERAGEIIIAADGDVNGAAMLQDLSILLGRARCKFLTYPKSRKDRGRDRCKDLNEVLEDYGTKGVVETINRAQWLKVDGVFRMGELPPVPPMVIYEPAEPLIAENFKMRLGDFSVITGTPGFGKTTYANHLFCGMALANGLTIAWASFEQEPQVDHRRTLRAWRTAQDDVLEMSDHARLGVADQWIETNHLFIVRSEDEDATLEWLLEKMQVAVVRFGAKVIVIDPWNELEHDRRQGETETEYTGRAIRSLKRFAKTFRVHISVIAHPTKSAKDGDGNYRMPTLYDISGSANWYNKADLGVIVHRENEDHTIIKTQKSRYHELIGRPGEVRVAFAKRERIFIPVERIA